MSDMSADQFASFLEAQVAKSTKSQKSEETSQSSSGQPVHPVPPVTPTLQQFPQGITPTTIPFVLQQQFIATQSKINELYQKLQTKQITKQEFDQQYMKLVGPQQLIAQQQFLRAQQQIFSQPGFRPPTPQQQTTKPLPQQQQPPQQQKPSVIKLSPEIQKQLYEYYKTPREQKQQFLQKHPAIIEVLKQQIQQRQKQQQQALQKQQVLTQQKPPPQVTPQPPAQKTIKRPPPPPPPLQKQQPQKKQKMAPPPPGEKRGPGRPKSTTETNVSDLTDVLAGVNLEQESATLLGEDEDDEEDLIVEYIPEPWFLEKDILQQKMKRIVMEAELKDISDECLEFMSLATQDLMRTMIEGLMQASKHRKEMENMNRSEVLEKILQEQKNLKKKTRMKFFGAKKQQNLISIENQAADFPFEESTDRLPTRDQPRDGKILITKADVIFYLENQLTTRKSKQLYELYLKTR